MPLLLIIVLVSLPIMTSRLVPAYLMMLIWGTSKCNVIRPKLGSTSNIIRPIQEYNKNHKNVIRTNQHNKNHKRYKNHDIRPQVKCTSAQGLNVVGESKCAYGPRSMPPHCVYAKLWSYDYRATTS